MIVRFTPTPTSLTRHSIQRVKDSVSIVDVISDVTTLRRKGRALMGLCPFHSESTPSFTVREAEGMYKCFGCGRAGDAYSFIMEVNGVSFNSAVELLADRANLRLETLDREPRVRRREATPTAKSFRSGIDLEAFKSFAYFQHLTSRDFAEDIE